MTAPLPPRASRAYSADDRGLRGEDAGEVVGDRDADAHRRAVGVAGEVQQPAVADADAVEAGPGRFGPSWPNIEMRTVTRRGSHVGRADVPLLERAGPEVLDDDVGGRGEPPEQLLALGRAQVERDALAAAPFDRPEQRVRTVVAVDERADLAHEVAAARLLDLDDLRALLAEQAGAERRGDARAEVEDADAVRASDRHARGIVTRARVSPVGGSVRSLQFADNSRCHEQTDRRPDEPVPAAVAVGALLAPVVACLRGDDDGVADAVRGRLRGRHGRRPRSRPHRPSCRVYLRLAPPPHGADRILTGYVAGALDRFGDREVVAIGAECLEVARADAAIAPIAERGVRRRRARAWSLVHARRRGRVVLVVRGARCGAARHRPGRGDRRDLPVPRLGRLIRAAQSALLGTSAISRRP